MTELDWWQVLAEQNRRARQERLAERVAAKRSLGRYVRLLPEYVPYDRPWIVHRADCVSILGSKPERWEGLERIPDGGQRCRMCSP